MTPYDFQVEILDAVRAGWDECDRQLVVSPTGSGKTVMFSLMAAEQWHQNGVSTLILVDQDELVWQALDKLKTVTGIEGRPEKAEHHASIHSRVVVATVQSMARRLDKWPADIFGLVIADEADKSISAQWQTVLKHFDKHAKVCGFTATPHRTDQRNLGCYYQRGVEKENLFSLINKGYLAPVRVSMLPIQIDLSQVHLKDGDFDAGELDAVIGPHLLKIAEAIRDYAPFRKTVVFLPLIKTAEKFAEIARGVGLLAESIHGKSGDREEKLARFARGEFDVLANSALLTRGYDDRFIDCVVPCRPTKSVTLYFQMVGRGTRLAPGKPDMLLMDFLYQSQKHLVCRPANLIAKSDLEAQAITELAQEKCAGLPADIAAQMPLDLQALAGAETQKREEALRKRLEEHKRKKAKTITAAEFAIEHGSLDLAEYEPVMQWESAAVSERQMQYLKQAKIDLSTVSCRGHASKLLDMFFKNRKPRLASPKAVALMRRMRGVAASIGITDLENVTAAQAGRFFSALKEKKRQPELV